MKVLLIAALVCACAFQAGAESKKRGICAAAYESASDAVDRYTEVAGSTGDLRQESADLHAASAWVSTNSPGAVGRLCGADRLSALRRLVVRLDLNAKARDPEKLDLDAVEERVNRWLR